MVQGSPGVYLLGGNLVRTRRSSYIGGAADDSRAVADDLHGFLYTNRKLRPRHWIG